MTTTARVRGPYAKSKRVRESILAIATEVFGESGFSATTMKEVAARAGISESGLAHHFPNKDELLSAVLEAHEGRASKTIPRELGEAALEAMLDVIVDDSAQPGIVELHAMIAAEATSVEHPAHDHYFRRYEDVRTFAVGAFSVLAEQGRLRVPMSPEELGAAFIAMMDGLQLQWLYNRDVIHSADILRKFLRAVIA